MDPQAITNTSTSSPLLSVPLEVLLQIVYHLTTPDYCSLRLTCKHVERTLLTSFSKEYFTKRQFMLTEFSLQTLADISKSRFSATLSNVIFGLERPSRDSHRLDSRAAVPPSDVHTKHNKSLQECVDFMTLLHTGQDVEMLAEAFSNLKNLEAVGMRDFNSRSRRRDFPYTEWKSYGWRTFEDETGVRLLAPSHSVFASIYPPDQDLAYYLSRVFLNVLRALGKSSTHPKRFEVILRHSSLYDHAFNLPKYVVPVVEPVLANLRTLFLDLNWKSPPVQVVLDNVATPCPSYLLRKFLSKVPEVEHLRLNFEFHPGAETNDVLSWLSKPVPLINPTTIPSLLPAPPQPVHLAKLRQLDIGMVKIEPRFLIAVIRKYQATLRVISFHKVTLLQTNSSDTEAKANLWTRLFDKLSQLNLTLSGINMSVLNQEQAWSHREWPVTFKDTRDPRSKMWAGSDTQSGLRDYVAQVVVEGLDLESESSQSDGSDEDVSMDDDHQEDDDEDDEDDD